MNKLSRSENYNLLKNIEKKIPKEIILNIFKKMSMIKFFEEEIRDAHKNKLTTPLVYLSLGQESVSASISEVFKKHFVLDLVLKKLEYFNVETLSKTSSVDFIFRSDMRYI